MEEPGVYQTWWILSICNSGLLPSLLFTSLTTFSIALGPERAFQTWIQLSRHTLVPKELAGGGEVRQARDCYVTDL